ncbi:uncharacterized protein LOC127780306 [Oryza glaberrima]|uniref:uncharacterized protein LOC127780306 n=1 Tax=Oryza glaberrima TaxID=4538 RepID=UPI00224BFB54|nr:uncharacterized protein LOC127780306 [Oryza glaberrima]
MRGIIPVQAKNLHPAEIELIAIAMAGNEADDHTSAAATVLRELSGTRVEVARAREAAVKAWLSAMPLGEELERLRAELAAAKNRLAATAAEMPPLKGVEAEERKAEARVEEAEALRRAAKARRAAAAARLAEARARKREAAEQGRRRDAENERSDNTARRSRSGGTRLAARKLPSWLCAIGRSGGRSQATAMAAHGTNR